MRQVITSHDLIPDERHPLPQRHFLAPSWHAIFLQKPIQMGLPVVFPILDCFALLFLPAPYALFPASYLLDGASGRLVPDR
jgi:hypothetical protein